MKLRLRFSKRGKIRFTGHRDVARLFERAIRIVGIPVAYTEGFSPRQKVSFGLALPTCYESDAEFLDIFLAEQSIAGSRSQDATDEQRRIVCTGQGAGRELSLVELAEHLSAALPVGLDVAVIELVERGGPSLQESIVACTWQFSILDFAGDPDAAVTSVLASDELIVERMKKRKPVSENIRGAIESLVVLSSDGNGPVFEAVLSASPRVVRPAELVPVLAPSHELALARRTHQWTEQDRERCEPLAAPASAPHAMHAS